MAVHQRTELDALFEQSSSNANAPTTPGSTNYWYTVRAVSQADGHLWGMGFNEDGELGNGTFANANVPVFMAANVAAVAAGGSHSLFVTTDGLLWATGYNGEGQLGDGTYNSANQPVAVASNVVAVAAGGGHSLFIRADGSLTPCIHRRRLRPMSSPSRRAAITPYM